MTFQARHINPADGPAPTGYTHAVEMGPGRLLFISGQLPLDDQRALVGPGDMAAQATQALRNISRVLEAAGATWVNVAKLTIFVMELRAMPALRDVRAAFFAEQGVEPPAITTVGVVGLSVPGALIEIEAYAVVP